MICSALRPPALVSASRGLWGCKKSTRDHTRIAIATAATNNARMVAPSRPWLRRLPLVCLTSTGDLTSAAVVRLRQPLLQGPQFTSQELCDIGRPQRVIALAIEALKLPAADILAQQELHRPAALRADRRWRIFRHDAHAGPGGSATLSVTDNCRD